MKMSHSKQYMLNNSKFGSAMWDVIKLKSRVEET